VAFYWAWIRQKKTRTEILVFEGSYIYYTRSNIYRTQDSKRQAVS
jgi:hypothetical protein